MSRPKTVGLQQEEQAPGREEEDSDQLINADEALKVVFGGKKQVSIRDEQTRLWARKIGAVRSGDCRAGQELTIQRARSRNLQMAGQPTTSQILKLTPQIDAACLPEA